MPPAARILLPLLATLLPALAGCDRADDLDEIRERGVLRAVTRNAPATYFQWKGRVLGYEYELLKAFAEDLDLRLEVIVAAEQRDFTDYLDSGEADIAAGLIPITEYGKRQGVAFSDSYLSGKVGIVARRGENIKNPRSLSGRTIHVRDSGSHQLLLAGLRQKVPGIKMELALKVNGQRLIDKVAGGDFDLAVTDELVLRLERTWRDDVHFALGLQTDEYAWMVRRTSPELLAAVNEFFRRRGAGAATESLRKKYFESSAHPRAEVTRLNEKGHISPFDELVRKYAGAYGFDWRLVTAQIFQESGFNPRASSWTGARGLMQVMPDGAGGENLREPETGIRAGLEHLRRLYGKLADCEALSPQNAIRFALAAYNAGPGHLDDARELAEEKGWDHKVWFGNVEKAMLLLSEPAYYRKARHGYARGRETVDYVRRIEARFRLYTALLDARRRAEERLPGN